MSKLVTGKTAKLGDELALPPLKLAGSKPDLEGAFLTLWRHSGGVEPKVQYRFAPPRRWKFDFAWPLQLVAVEIEGGTWVAGRHTRGKGYAENCEKYNAAALAGWTVLRYTTDQLKVRVFPIIDEIKAALEQRKATA